MEINYIVLVNNEPEAAFIYKDDTAAYVVKRYIARLEDIKVNAHGKLCSAAEFLNIVLSSYNITIELYQALRLLNYGAESYDLLDALLELEYYF